MPLQLIDDGYTREESVKARGYPAVVVRFRPALPVHTRDYLIASRRADSGKAEMAAVVALLKKQVIGWDIIDAHGGAVPVTEAAILRVPEPVLVKIIDLVTGYGLEESDADEKNSDTGCASS